MDLRILGIDPGLATMGFGVIDSVNSRSTVVDYGVILTSKDETLPTRLALLEKGVKSLIEKYKPDEIALEELFFNNNVKTAIDVAQARGVILLVAQKLKIPIFEYTPLQVKTAVTGYGKAKKPQVMEMTRRLLNLEEVPKPDDTADALAIGICHAQAAGSDLRRMMYRKGI
jgi:crossover junction endodeoxyribonuclease RuvC